MDKYYLVVINIFVTSMIFAPVLYIFWIYMSLKTAKAKLFTFGMKFVLVFNILTIIWDVAYGYSLYSYPKAPGFDLRVFFLAKLITFFLIVVILLVNKKRLRDEPEALN